MDGLAGAQMHLAPLQTQGSVCTVGLFCFISAQLVQEQKRWRGRQESKFEVLPDGFSRIAE